ncbi:MAG: glycosyltransferase family 39 protein [Chloroflexi bacterium]|nr:glycosyltransferase family 39 protein [Chloroflexota bacterium]
MKQPKLYLYAVLQSPYFLPVCLFLAVLIRLLVIYLIQYEVTEDALWYYKRGVEIAAGQGYLNTDGAPTAFWPVGYPALLGLSFRLFGASVRTGQWLNLGMYMGIIICAYYICRELFQSETMSRIVVLILAFYPHHILYTALLLTEICFTFLILLGSLLLIKQLKKGAPLTLYLTGLVFGAAVLVKPQAILLPFVIVLAHCLMRRWRVKLALSTLLIGLGITSALIPWTIRNYQLFHTFIFVSTNGGINLLIGNHPEANGRYRWDDYLEQVWTHSDNESVRDVEARQLAIRYIREHPRQTLQLLPLKLFYLYRFDTQGIDLILAGVKNESTHIRQFLWAMKFVCQAYYMAVMATFGLAMLTFFQNRAQRWSTIGLGVILYFTAVYLPFFAEGRYQIQTIPWVVIYAAAPLAAWLTTSQRTMALYPQMANELA